MKCSSLQSLCRRCTICCASCPTLLATTSCSIDHQRVLSLRVEFYHMTQALLQSTFGATRSFNIWRCYRKKTLISAGHIETQSSPALRPFIPNNENMSSFDLYVQMQINNHNIFPLKTNTLRSSGQWYAKPCNKSGLEPAQIQRGGCCDIKSWCTILRLFQNVIVMALSRVLHLDRTHHLPHSR